VPTNEWSFVAVVYSSQTVTMYLNGAMASGTLGAPEATDPAPLLYLGRDPVNGTNFDGSIASVRLYGHALSPSEVAAIYSAVP
jgi:hypothetical protein